ncbi:hypothetical protein AAG906_021853 [Vitis piasezkii]
MDTQSQHTKVLDPIVVLQKGIRTGCPDAPSDGFVSHKRRRYGSVGLLLGIEDYQDPSSLYGGLYISLESVPLINGEEIFYVVMMTLNGRDTITLRAAGNHRCGSWLIASFCPGDSICDLVCFFGGDFVPRQQLSFFFVALFGTYLFATVIPLVAFAGSLNLILVWLCGKKWLEKTVSSAREVPFSRETYRTCHCLHQEHFNAGLRFPLPALFKEFLHFSQIPPVFIHPNVVRNADSIKGGEGAGGDAGWMGGLVEHEGHLVDWVEKTPFACVNKLFEIEATERHYKTLLSARNLMAVVRESQDYSIHNLPQKLPKEVVPGKHHIWKELSIYQEAKEADAEKRRKLLEDRDKRKDEGTIRKAPGQKRGADSAPKEAD